jgi:hypothetical protein
MAGATLAVARTCVVAPHHPRKSVTSASSAFQNNQQSSIINQKWIKRNKKIFKHLPKSASTI